MNNLGERLTMYKKTYPSFDHLVSKQRKNIELETKVFSFWEGRQYKHL